MRRLPGDLGHSGCTPPLARLRRLPDAHGLLDIQEQASDGLAVAGVSVRPSRLMQLACRFIPQRSGVANSLQSPDGCRRHCPGSALHHDR
jgi:hypothetical protein